MTTLRPVVMGTECAIAAGHYLAAEAGAAVLRVGGNAVDAGVATGLALGVLQSDIVNVAGVAPTLIWLADRCEIVNIDGVGSWPRAVRPGMFTEEHGNAIPEGVLRTVIPAAPAAWLTALERYGTMSFAEVAFSAIELARDGFPMHPLMAQTIAANESKYRRWPSNASIYLPSDHPPLVGDVFIQSDLAATLQYMVDQERTREAGGREAGIRAAYDAFYRHDIAKAIVDYHHQNGGLLTMDDLAEYRVSFEPTVSAKFGGVEVHCCGPWSQGPALAQAIALVREYDLLSLGHNRPEYVHTVTEVLKLAFADRELMGDPKFVCTRVDELMSEDYLATRRAFIRSDGVLGLVPPVDAEDKGGKRGNHSRNVESLPRAYDTSYVCVVDQYGNAFSATPSDVSMDTPVIPGTGLCPSSRGRQSRPDIDHPASVAPGKRPRLTPNPALAVKDNRPFFVFGTPGGDVQVQAMLQVFLNMNVFGMDVQSAIEAPRFATYSFPASFPPYGCLPRRLNLESRFSGETAAALGSLGHEIQWWPELSSEAGGVCAVFVDPETGVRHAGADPRRPSYALAW